ncbi:MAG: hypothetical protein IJX39_07540 [Clostridia bacterium]|nr:hypothetical protein [Clostridia bacterium]
MKPRSQMSAQYSVQDAKIVRESELLVAGRTVQYRLLEKAPQFFVEIACDTERCLLKAGQSFARAAHIFDLLIKGEVTPCTAEYIMDDLEVAERLSC